MSEKGKFMKFYFSLLSILIVISWWIYSYQLLRNLTRSMLILEKTEWERKSQKFSGLTETVPVSEENVHYCSLQVGSVSNFESIKVQFFKDIFLEIFNAW